MSDFGFYSAEEFFGKKLESREALIDQILHEKDSVIIAGKPKTGKSVLLFQLICSLTSGEPFLDRFEVKRRVLTHFGSFRRVKVVRQPRIQTS